MSNLLLHNQKVWVDVKGTDLVGWGFIKGLAHNLPIVGQMYIVEMENCYLQGYSSYLVAEGALRPKWTEQVP